jgi:hypothetical protein
MFGPNLLHPTLDKSQNVRFNILRPVLKTYLKGDTVLLGEWLLSFEGMRCFHLQSQAEHEDCLTLEDKDVTTLLNVKNYSSNDKEYHIPGALHPQTTECFTLHQKTINYGCPVCQHTISLLCAAPSIFRFKRQLISE